MRKFAWIAALALLVSANALASIDSGQRERDERVLLDVNLSFEAQRQAIEADLKDGKTYSELSDKDRVAVNEALDRMETALASAGGVTGLDAEQKVRVFNDQELVNSILAKAGDDSRLVCRREKQIGSNRITTQCMTALQRARQTEEARKTMTDSQRSSR